MKNYIFLVLTCFIAVSQVNAMPLKAESTKSEMILGTNDSRPISTWTEVSKNETKGLSYKDAIEITKNPGQIKTLNFISYYVLNFPPSYAESYALDTLIKVEWNGKNYITNYAVFKRNTNRFWFFYVVFGLIMLFAIIFSLFFCIGKRSILEIYEKYSFEEYLSKFILFRKEIIWIFIFTFTCYLITASIPGMYYSLGIHLFFLELIFALPWIAYLIRNNSIKKYSTQPNQVDDVK